MESKYKGRYTILDNRAEPSYEDYLADLTDRGLNYEEDDVPDYDEWAADEAEDLYECDLSNIEWCRAYKVPVLIEGSLGLWWGKPTIEPVHCDSVYDAVKRCIGEDIDYIKAEYDNGLIRVYATHHDGTNCFTIKGLSQKGVEKKKAKNAVYTDEDFVPLPYLYAIGVE